MATAAAALQQLGVTEEEYINYERNALRGRRLLYACLAILVYDYLLTFENEFFDVWRKPPRVSLAKFLFALNRYYPILGYTARSLVFSVDTLTKSMCRLNSFSGYSGTLNFATVELILMIRVWALYEKTKKMGAFLLFLYIAALSSTIALRKLHPQGLLKHLADPLPQSLTICGRSTPEEYFFLYTIGVFVETSIFLLLVWKAWSYSSGLRHMPFITALLKHGTVYYAVVVVTLAVAMASTFSTSLFQPIADSNLIVAVTSIACNRLILSLRGLYFHAGLVSSLETSGPSATRVEEDNLHRYNDALEYDQRPAYSNTATNNHSLLGESTDIPEEYELERKDSGRAPPTSLDIYYRKDVYIHTDREYP